MTSTLWAGERLELLPQRAVHWPDNRTLIIADPHFGKDAVFRGAGIPVPAAAMTAGVRRLESLIGATGAHRLVVLGDFLHARRARCEPVFTELRRFRATHPRLDITLVRGNHDLHAGDPPDELGVGCFDGPLRVGPFAFTHHPSDPAPLDGFEMAGHIHPVIRLHDDHGATLRAPCYFFGPTVALLPAFGVFTGGHPIRPGRGDRVFVIADDEVLEVTKRRGHDLLQRTEKC